MIICDNEKRTCMLIEIAISGERNIIKKKPRKFQNIKTLQYKYNAR
jgi:hypothetical protein